jgi:outer membrane protein
MKYLLAFMLALSPAVLSAQGPKIGYLNSMEILYQLPEIKDVQDGLMKYSQELEGELQKMYARFQELQQEIESKRATWSATILSLKSKQLEEEAQNIQRTQATFEEELDEKRMLLLSPLIEKVNEAVQKVAKAKGYSYVMDVSKGVLLYADPDGDISNDVREALKLPKNAPKPAEKK